MINVLHEKKRKEKKEDDGKKVVLKSGKGDDGKKVADVTGNEMKCVQRHSFNSEQEAQELEGPISLLGYLLP